MKRISRILLGVLALLSLLDACKMNSRKVEGEVTDNAAVESLPELSDDELSVNDDRPYPWMNDEEYERYLRIKNDIAWQDSLARILSVRLNKNVRMDDFLRSTFTDGEKVYYWNRFWGDLVEVPSGFDVSMQFNWSWQMTKGSCFTGFAGGKDSVTVYVSAGHQVVYESENEFTELFLEDWLQNRPLENLKHSYGRESVRGREGEKLSYIYCTFEGKNPKTGMGEYHKTVRALPGCDGTFDLTVEYPLPKIAEVQKVINTLSSYPNIKDVSDYGEALL